MELKGRTGKIAAIIFLAVIALPVFYAAYKEIQLSRQTKQNATPAATKQP